MPRPPRIDFPDAVYHVTSRGNGRADIFYNNGDRQRFLEQLWRLCRRRQGAGVCQLPVLQEYGRDMATATALYRAYVEACLTEDDGPLLEAMAASRYAIGGAAFMERTEGQIERRRSGRLQDQDLDLPRRTSGWRRLTRPWPEFPGSMRIVFLAWAECGLRKVVALELAAQLADLSGRAVGEHYVMCASAIGANRRRLAMRPELLQVIETLGRRLRKRSLK